MDERQVRMALMCVSEPGDLRLAESIRDLGLEGTWREIVRDRHGLWGRRHKALDLAAVERATRAHGLGFLIPGDPGWPTQLDALAHAEVSEMGGAPLGLWIRGERRDLAGLAERSIAVVGSRASSAYGEMMATEIAAEVSDREWAVVSGGAYGIDAAAHRGALAGPGGTVCVVACGLDRDYPRSHHDLLATVAESGAVVGELPPGAHPMRSRFLSRNRLIAGLATGTVIVEAAPRSGAKNTVNWAEALGRRVMAVPGPAHATTSATPHALIRSHAADLVTGGLDVLELLAPLGQEMLPLPEADQRPIDGMDRRHRAVFEHVPGSGEGITVPQVAAASGLPAGLVHAMLDDLLVAGFVLSHGGRWVLAPGSVG